MVENGKEVETLSVTIDKNLKFRSHIKIFVGKEIKI